MITALTGLPVASIYLQLFQPNPVDAIGRRASTIRIQR